MIDQEEKSYKQWIEDQEENFLYFNPAVYADGTVYFPIVASGLTYQSTVIIETKDLIGPKEAGFSICLKNSVGTGKVDKSLENAAGANMKLFTFNIDLIKSDNNSYEEKVVKPGLQQWLAGIVMTDEPEYDMIIGIEPTSTGRETLQKEYRKFKSLSSDYTTPIILINLQGFSGGYRMPTDAQVLEFMEEMGEDFVYTDLQKCLIDSSGEECKYEVYLNAFQHFFKPSFYCYDLYPISEISRLVFEGIKNIVTNKEEGYINVFYNAFFEKLELYSTMVRRYKRPFWNYMKSMCFLKQDKKNNDYNFSPPVLEQYLRFAAFSTLAYGAKGLLYWTYAPGQGNDEERYLSALTNWRGGRTATWYFAQKINTEIQNFKDIFLNTSLYKVDQRYNGSIEKEHSSISVHDVNYNILIHTTNRKNPDSSTYQTNLLVTRLRENDSVSANPKTYVMVVNTSPLEYTDFTIRVDYGKVIEKTPRRSTETPSNQPLVVSEVNQRFLPPGGYRIFEIP